MTGLDEKPRGDCRCLGKALGWAAFQAQKVASRLAFCVSDPGEGGALRNSQSAPDLDEINKTCANEEN